MSEENHEEISIKAHSRRDESLSKHPYFLMGAEDVQKPPKNPAKYLISSSHFTPLEKEIIQTEAKTIVQKTTSKHWSAVDVAKAFCKSAAVAQQITNCLTEIFFDEAIAQAKALDDHLAKTGQPKGPLHGLPISMKDCFITPPHPSSLGMSCYGNSPTTPEMESTLVTILRDLGAVQYVKTNVPTGMMMMETDNRVWGPTLNGIHSGLSAGGSSGGEGALIAMRGSPIGVGTDIGGSIRIPSAYNGLYGLKPSFSRFPAQGMRSGIPGQEFIFSVNGPMSRHLSSLSLYASSVLSALPAASPWTKDPKCIPMPWRAGPHITPAGRKLRIGIMGLSDGLIHAQPPIERALHEVAAALKAEGHEVVTWTPKDHDKMFELVAFGFGGFGGSAMVPLLKKHNEPMFPAMAGYWAAAEQGQSIFGPNALRDATLKRNALQKQHLDRWLATAVPEEGKGPIDGMICATSPWPACRLGITQNSPGHKLPASTTAVWSLMDVACATFPVTEVDAKKDPKRKDGEIAPHSELDQWLQDDWDPDFYEGAPVCLQMVGERLGEEKLLEALEVVDAAVKKYHGEKSISEGAVSWPGLGH